MQPPRIFDREARRLRRGRTESGGFFAETMVSDLLERFDALGRPDGNVLIVGAEPQLIAGMKARGVDAVVIDPSPRRAPRAMDEDALTTDGDAFGAIIACGTLDTVDDLPGALFLMRKRLRPEGVLLASFAGAPSLPNLRAAVARADAAFGIAVQRVHPQIDVRAAGDLLVRAGFARAVADVATHDVAYRDMAQLLADLRAAAATNVLAGRHGVTRRWLALAAAAFAGAAAEDGRIHETLSYIMLTGWAGPE